MLDDETSKQKKMEQTFMLSIFDTFCTDSCTGYVSTSPISTYRVIPHWELSWQFSSSAVNWLWPYSLRQTELTYERWKHCTDTDAFRTMYQAVNLQNLFL